MIRMSYTGSAALDQSSHEQQHEIETVRPRARLAANALAGHARLMPTPPSSLASSNVHHALREETVANDAATSVPLPLALFWRGLTLGTRRVVDAFFTRTRCYVVTAGIVPGSEPPLEGQRLEILERVLSGGVQKAVALDLDLAASTIAFNARLALRSIGITSKASRVHPLLMRAAKAARDGDLSALGSVSVVFPHGVSLQAVGIPRPDIGLAGSLPPAARAVIQGLIEGHSYEEIAQQRGTSQRTIANQVAAVFQRKRVSGRNELVHRLFAEGTSEARGRESGFRFAGGRPAASLELASAGS